LGIWEMDFEVDISIPEERRKKWIVHDFEVDKVDTYRKKRER
jgi:hypothetical protein